MKSPAAITTLRFVTRSRAFTLIEVMVVCGIMGLIVAAGIPAFAKMLKKQGIRKVTADVEQVCYQARKMAIFSGKRAAVMFHPHDHRLEVETAPTPDASGLPGNVSTETSDNPQAASIPDDYTIEMLDINLLEYNESEWARVWFYPNGTSDEMTLVLRSSKNEWVKLSLEVTTGLVSVTNVQ
jgi:prepilin-type N-terminal cleavage/methylation domain-containing protein